MAVAKITKALVEKPEVPEKGHLVTWDSSPGMGGFGIRVSPTGRVAFLVRYWTGSRERWKTLGAYPRLTLTKARARAKGYLRDAGDDPVEKERLELAAQKAAEAQTVEALAAATEDGKALTWLNRLPQQTTRKGTRISPRTVEQYESAMRLYILPALGRKPVTEVTRRDVEALHQKVTKRGGPYMANRVANVLSIFYGWCGRVEAVPSGFNPARRPPRNPEQSRGEDAAVRLSRDQEARLVAAIYRRMKDDPIGATAVLALLDTGRRKEEILAMRWERLDLDAGTVNLGRTKGKTADRCYLPARVCEAIRQLPRIVGNPWIFSGTRKDGRRAGVQSAWEAIKQEAGLERISPDLDGFKIHDLRHHRISELLAAGVSESLVIRQTGHTSYSQLKVYGHVEVDDVARVLSRLEPVEPAPSPEVVEMSKS